MTFLALLLAAAVIGALVLVPVLLGFGLSGLVNNRRR